MSYQWNGPDQIAALVDAATGTTQFAYDARGHLVGATFGDGAAQYPASEYPSAGPYADQALEIS